ncbi:MAG TPA: aldo/keto reductase [Actinomycetota bacterium]|nr:aldo/keto reductase [Actinomycetota bacterium]
MQKRNLGLDGPEITILGFGSWAAGGPYKFGWGPTDDQESIAAIRHAIGSGINWIDTAAIYGLGHSEEVVGKATEGMRVGEDVFVFTKCGGFFKEELGKVVYDLRPDSIARECEQSLRRLGLDTIDLYQIHWPDNSTGTAVEDSWEAMSRLVEEGKVRWIGVSNFEPALLDRCGAVHHITSVQPPLNLVKRRARNDVIPWCREHGAGVIVYSPMASGLLTGKYDHDSFANLARDDWRRSSAAFQEPELSRIFDLVERLKVVAEGLGTTLPLLAIAWTLSVPGVTGAIVGARRPEQVDGWIDAGSLSLDDATMERLEQCVRESRVGEG